MRVVRIIAVVAVLLGPIAVARAQAQNPLLSRMVQDGWLRWSIVGGRVTVGGTRSGAIGTTRNSNSGKESISIQNENGRLHVSYERTTPEEKIAFSASSPGDQFGVLREPPNADSPLVRVRFDQAPNEKFKTSLTLGWKNPQRVFRAQGIWQLLIAQPQECRQHLVPLLEILRPDWKLADTAMAVEQKLLQQAGGNRTSDHAGWAALVAQLADESFAKRDAADRALRSGDPCAIAYLRQLDFDRLDAEQQFRVHRIIEALSGQNSEDSVEQLAASLAGDPTVWLALLARPEPATRLAAARQLAALLGEPIPVDPAADPDTQKDRREQLRARIEGK